MDEATGCGLLKEQFTQAGFDIHENYPLKEDPIRFNVDGFDPVQRIGYEYITTEAGDRSELTPELIAALEAKMALGATGGLYIFLIDELHVSGPDELRHAAAQFIARVKSLRGSQQ
jgi:hypothetical protein